MKNIDTTDAGILRLLRGDARNRTTADIGEALDLAPSTVGTRIKDLERRGIIDGYDPRLDYDELGFQHQFVIAGTAPFEQRRTVTDEVADIDSVVNVRNMMTTDVNVAVKIVGSSRGGIERSLEQLQRRNLAIERIEILEGELHQPTNMFADFVSGGE